MSGEWERRVKPENDSLSKDRGLWESISGLVEEKEREPCDEGSLGADNMFGTVASVCRFKAWLGTKAGSFRERSGCIQI